MAENEHDLEQPPVGHETSDVDTWAIGKFAIALVLVSVAAMAMLMGLFHYFIVREGPMPPKAYSSLEKAEVKQPPAPQLETTPVEQLSQERAAEDQKLNSYGWVDKQHGIVRIPIDQAIDLLAKKGLPSRAEAPIIDNVSVPTESGPGLVGNQK
jgi:hypothetical protein